MPSVRRTQFLHNIEQSHAEYNAYMLLLNKPIHTEDIISNYHYICCGQVSSITSSL